MAKIRHWRTWIQALWTLITNCYLAGFAAGRIYTGPLKQICVPGLNCYSCPGALFSCPIGALQAVIGSARYRFSLYAGGFLALCGAVLGRFTCGWLCPFGLVQDLIYKIPGLKKLRGFPGDALLRWFKYVVLAVFVILMPMVVVDFTGQGMPAFCKYICPSGTLMGGIPLVSSNPSLQQAAGPLFTWKVFVLAGVAAAALFIYRPFCRYICPLGAVYGVCNRVALCRLRWDEDRCIHCGKCYRACKMEIDPTRNAGSCECIRCGDCVKACPKSALSIDYGLPQHRRRGKSGSSSQAAGPQR